MFSKFLKHEAGNFSTMFALSLLPIMIGVGVSVDYSSLSKADNAAQGIADAVALAAAVYVNQNGEHPETDAQGYVEGRVYTAKELGYDIGDGTATVVVTYDDADGTAKVTVSGVYKTAFMGLMQVDTLDFGATASAVYNDPNATALSVFFALDVSGSMKFDDKIDTYTSNDYYEKYSTVVGAQAREVGLRATTKTFMKSLEDIMPASSGARKILRTAMYPYAGVTMKTMQVDPKWGLISDSEINGLVALDGTNPLGGTNSWAPMQDALHSIRKEPGIHKAENGNDDPLKYVVFMTDGVNDNTSSSCKMVVVGYTWWGYPIKEEVCTYSTVYDEQTLKVCQDMKDEGVEIYTIAFSLAPGRYHRNDGGIWANKEFDRYHYVLEQDISDRANLLLSSCASSPEHYFQADDTAGLADAMERISGDIIENVVRLTL